MKLAMEVKREFQKALSSQVLEVIVKKHLLMSKLTAHSWASSARVLHWTPSSGKIYFRNVQRTSQDVIYYFSS